MRRKEREVTDKKEMIDILDECNTMHVAFSGVESPYVVPLSFGYSFDNDMLVLYFHCAKAGMKLDILKTDSKVSFACDTFLGYERTAHGITTRYKSVIGFGTCTVLKEKKEILQGMRFITDHCGFSDYPVEGCAELAHLTVCRINVSSMSGKRNLPCGLTTADLQAKK